MKRPSEYALAAPVTKWVRIEGTLRFKAVRAVKAVKAARAVRVLAPSPPSWPEGQ